MKEKLFLEATMVNYPLGQELCIHFTDMIAYLVYPEFPRQKIRLSHHQTSKRQIAKVHISWMFGK